MQSNNLCNFTDFSTLLNFFRGNNELRSIESKFIATPEKGEVSSLLIHPDGAKWLLVLGHGASTNMRHSTLQTIAERLADIGIATFRYQFPYMERGGGGREAQAVALATVRSAVAAAHEAAGDLAILVGGHSYSGRMSSLTAAEAPIKHVRGLVFFGSHCILLEERGQNAPSILLMLLCRCYFYRVPGISWRYSTCWNRSAKISGTRRPYTCLDTADHGFKVLNVRVNLMKMSL